MLLLFGVEGVLRADGAEFVLSVLFDVLAAARVAVAGFVYCQEVLDFVDFVGELLVQVELELLDF